MPQSTGPLYPSTVSEVLSPDSQWSGESGAAASGGESATTSLDFLVSRSRPLRATGFDFSSVPSGATIVGIGCRIEVSDDGGGFTAGDSAQLVDGGAAVGTIDSTDKPISALGSVLAYGGKGELWGVSPKTRDLDADFGFQFVAKRTSGGTVVVSVDSLSLEVWYETISIPAFFPPTASRRRF